MVAYRDKAKEFARKGLGRLVNQAEDASQQVKAKMTGAQNANAKNAKTKQAETQQVEAQQVKIKKDKVKNSKSIFGEKKRKEQEEQDNLIEKRENLKKRRTIAAVVLGVLVVFSVGSVFGFGLQGKSTSQNTTTQTASNQTSQSTQTAVQTIAATNQLKVHYIDVGQGDSEFLELPDGKSMLIDAGTSSSGTTVVNYIKALGYSKIDYVVASHPHEDHIGGLPAVFEAFEIGEVWAPKQGSTTQAYEIFLTAVANKGLSINAAVKGKSIGSSSLYTTEILSPSESSSYSDLNDWSAVISVKYSGKVFLFSGDASTSVVSSALSSHVDVLKVAHHGSDTGTSKALISLLTPTYAVISCGVGNSYGHPANSTLEVLASVSLFRTDTQKTIVATCKDGTISFNTSPVAAYRAPVVTVPQTTQSTSTSTVTVYITNTGEKYHLDGCRYLSKSKIAISLADAKAQSYTACSVCKPPS